MTKSLPGIAFALALASTPALAQTDSGVPGGWVKFDSVKKIQMWTPEKGTVTPAGRQELLPKLREIYDVFEDIYVLDKPVINAGGAGSKFPEKDRRQINLLLFASDVEYDKWLLEEGKSLADIHQGRYLDTVGFPLVEGALPKERWPELWQLLSLVFIHHHLYFDPPLWLNEGLSVYFSYASKKGKPTDFASFNDRLDRLRAQSAAGEAAPVMKLLARRTETLSTAERDAAWVLVHLLMTHAKNIFVDMTRCMSGLEQAGFDGEAQIIDDLHRVCVHVLKGAFQGEKGLQEAWIAHRDNLLKNPLVPGRLPKAPVAIPSVAMCLDLAVNATLQGVDRSPYVRLSGGVRPSFDWGGKIVINAAVGSGKKWSENYGVTSGYFNEKGSTLKWDAVELPSNTGQVRLEIWWTPDSGAVYRFYRHADIKKSLR